MINAVHLRLCRFEAPCQPCRGVWAYLSSLTEIFHSSQMHARPLCHQEDCRQKVHDIDGFSPVGYLEFEARPLSMSCLSEQRPQIRARRLPPVLSVLAHSLRNLKHSPSGRYPTTSTTIANQTASLSKSRSRRCRNPPREPSYLGLALDIADALGAGDERSRSRTVPKAQVKSARAI